MYAGAVNTGQRNFYDNMQYIFSADIWNEIVIIYFYKTAFFEIQLLQFKYYRLEIVILKLLTGVYLIFLTQSITEKFWQNINISELWISNHKFFYICHTKDLLKRERWWIFIICRMNCRNFYQLLVTKISNEYKWIWLILRHIYFFTLHNKQITAIKRMQNLCSTMDALG